MSPFVIQCTTCKARLRVTDPALVGDILACPKCESMVHVSPPAATASGLAIVKGAAVAQTAVAQAAVAQPSLSTTMPAPASQPGAAGEISFSLDELLSPPAVASAPQIKPNTQSSVASPAGMSTAPPIVATTVPVAAAPIMGHALLAKLVENWWVLACGFAIGIVVGVGGWIVASMAKPDVAVMNPEQAAANRQEASVSESPANPQLNNIGHEQLAASTNEELAAKEHSVGKPVEPVAGQVQVKQSAAADPAVDESPAAEEVQKVDADLNSDASAEAAVEIDPKGSVHDEQNPQPASKENVAAVDMPETAKPEPITAEKFANNIADKGPAEVVRPEPTAIDPKDVRPIPEPKPEAPPLRLVTKQEIKQQLSRPLLALEFDEKIPLAQFIDLMQQMSGVKIEIDAKAAAGIGKSSTVAVKLQNTTIARALQNAALQHGLVCELKEDRVVLTRKQ